MDLKHRHSWYTLNLPTWRKLESAHSGQDVAAYLVKDPLEAPSDYQRRQESAFYSNQVKAATDVWLSGLCRKNPSRELPPELANTLPDFDRTGTPVNLFWRRVAEVGLVFGMAAVVVDLPAVPAEAAQLPATKATRQLLRERHGFRPYASVVAPTSILDWAVDEHGKLAWVVIDRPYTAPGQPLEKVEYLSGAMVWFPDRWQWWAAGDGSDVKLDRPELVAEGNHPFGRVPVVPVYLGERLGVLQARSPLASIADTTLQLFNLQSLIRQAAGGISLPRLLVKDNRDLGRINTSLTRALNVSEGGDAKLLYLPADGVRGLLEVADRLKSELRGLVYFASDMKRESAQVQSAEKSRLDLQGLHSALSGWATALQDSEREVWQLMAVAEGINPESITVSWETRFDMRSSQQRLQEAMQFASLDLPSPTARQFYYGELVRSLLEDAPPEVVKAAVAELEQAEARPWPSPPFPRLHSRQPMTT